MVTRDVGWPDEAGVNGASDSDIRRVRDESAPGCWAGARGASSIEARRRRLRGRPAGAEAANCTIPSGRIWDLDLDLTLRG